jgi:ankyrin repeat protein
MNKNSDLHGACLFPKSGVAEVIRLVYECDADVNEQNNDGDTPLHIACSCGYRDRKRYSDHDSDKPTDIVEALMELGADVNITNDAKQRPHRRPLIISTRTTTAVG